MVSFIQIRIRRFVRCLQGLPPSWAAVRVSDAGDGAESRWHAIWPLLTSSAASCEPPPIVLGSVSYTDTFRNACHIGIGHAETATAPAKLIQDGEANPPIGQGSKAFRGLKSRLAKEKIYLARGSKDPRHQAG